MNEWCICWVCNTNSEFTVLYLKSHLSCSFVSCQMTASNLAICFAPSLFHVYGLRETSPSPASPQPRGQKLRPATGQKELHEQLAAQECLTYMIIKAKELFSVSERNWNFSFQIGFFLFGYIGLGSTYNPRSISMEKRIRWKLLFMTSYVSTLAFILILVVCV